MFKRFGERIKRACQRHHQYFADAGHEIAQQNLHSLCLVSLFLTFLVILLLFVTPQIIQTWQPTPQHLLFAPVSAVYFLFSLWYERRPAPTSKLIQFVCFLFCTTVFFFVVAIDVFPYPDQPSTFLPLFLVVAPVVFIFQYGTVFLATLLSEVAYALVLSQFKSPDIVQIDLFGSLAGVLVALLVAAITINLRTWEYHLRSRYRNLSRMDALTGIMNKSNCEAEIRAYCSQMKPDETCALLVLDVDEFKTFNDQLGHWVGDLVLGEIGALLLQTFHATDIIGRFGGDEFIVLMRDIPDETIVRKKCAAIHEGLSSFRSRELPIMCSIGAAVLQGGPVSYEVLFQSADHALYETKAFCKGHYMMHYVHPVPAGSLPLLLIAGDSATRSTLRSALSHAYQIVEAADGDDVLSELSCCGAMLRAVFLPTDLDGIPGIELLHYMKSRSAFSKIPVLLISDEPLPAHCEADAILMLPLHGAQAAETLSNLLTPRTSGT